MTTKTVLITGGSGFIGQALTKYLSKRGVQVHNFDIRPQNASNLYQCGSLLDFDQVSAAVQGHGAVYHLGGLLGTTELLDKSIEAVDVNIKGSLHILEACRQAGVRHVFFPTKPNDWLNTYSITKHAGEAFAQMYSELYNLDVRILRLLNVYGPGQSLFPIRKAVPLMILQALYDLPIEVYGNGQQPIDLIYVDDLAHISVEYMELESGDATVRDTGCTTRMSVNELVDLIRQMTSSNSAVRYLPMRDGENPDHRVHLLDNKSAIDLLGLKNVTTDVEVGLTRTIAYYQNLPEKSRNAALKFYCGRTLGRCEVHSWTRHRSNVNFQNILANPAVRPNQT